MNSRSIAEFLEAIPKTNQNSRALCTLVSDPASANHATGIAQILLTIGVVVLEGDNVSSETLIKSRSEAATYFLRSLAQYVRSGANIVEDWDRAGVALTQDLSSGLASGSNLVYLLEARRVNRLSGKRPIREVVAAHCIIKAQRRFYRRPFYLFQYDSRAQQYQLIGGRKRDSDLDIETTMRREIKEELPLNRFEPNTGFRLELSVRLSAVNLSPTFGALTRYNFSVFNVAFSGSELHLGPADRWLSVEEIYRGQSKDRKSVANALLLQLESELPGGLGALPVSIERQRVRFGDALRETRAVEKLMILLALVSMLATVVLSAC